MRKGNVFDIVLGAGIFITLTTIAFIKKVVKAGRIPELLISAPIVVVSYYLLWMYRANLEIWYFLIPAGVFYAYWYYLFSIEKITSPRAKDCWADRSWWWTLDGWQFEIEVAEIFALNGYKAEVTKKTGDGGVDIILYKEGRKILVQCKHYKAAIGPEVVRALWGVREDFNSQEVILVASSGITEASKKFVKNKAFRVYDLEDIIRMGLRPSYHSTSQLPF